MADRSVYVLLLCANLVGCLENVNTYSDCGGSITSEVGAIESPRYPGNYQNDQNCVWILNGGDQEEQLRLEFTVLNLEDGGTICKNDYVIIRDGRSQAAPLLGKFCGKKLPERIWASSPHVYIQFISNGQNTGKGFRLEFVSLPTEFFPLLSTVAPTSEPEVSCGGVLTGNDGEIHSPGYPELYKSNQFCRWFVEATDPASEIEMHIVSVDIEQHPTCQYDYVSIRNTFNTDDLSILKLCGEQTPQKIYGRRFLIEFKSDDTTSRMGFKIEWKIVKSGNKLSSPNARNCRTEQSGFVGMLTTGGYPENYGNNETCDWLITSEASTTIQLRFTDFDLETSQLCKYDFLEIYDGRTQKSNLIGRYCGNEIPDVIESNTNQLYLLFSSDSADTRRGFEATWIALTRGAGSRKKRSGLFENCGGVFTEKTGEILSPNHPSTYPPSTNCEWVIKTDTLHRIVLTFHSFSLEKHSVCRYDKVEIYEGETKKGKLIDSYCGGTSPGKITFDGNALLIRFVSDTTTQRNGFRATWTLERTSSVTPSDCGGTLNGQEGILTSPGYPKFNLDRSICAWTIEVPEGGKIQFEIVDLDIAEHPGCGKGYVQLGNGLSLTHDNLGTFCGFILPRAVVSKSNKLSVDFLSDGSGKTRGFRAKWKVIYPQPTQPPSKSDQGTPCGKMFSAESGSITRSSATKNCSWSIRVPSAKQIRISFIYINLAYDPDCRREQVEIRDGESGGAPLLTRACGILKPISVTSTSNQIYIQYTIFQLQRNSRLKLYWQVADDSSDKNAPFNAVSCGVTTAPAKSVVNGAKQGVGTLPWVVAIIGLFGRVHCGGAILSSEWILTAAHCFDSFDRLPWKLLWRVRAGEYNLNVDDGTEQNVRIGKMYIHPKYNKKTFDNDITLLRTEQPFMLDDNVNAVCLPSATRPYKEGKKCSVAGWGARKYLRQPKEPLVHVLPKLANTQKCNKTYEGKITMGMVCAGNKGVDSCQGDGGSPLTCVEQNKHYAFGLVSWGNGCAFPGKFGVYTDVRKYLSWIKEVVETRT